MIDEEVNQIECRDTLLKLTETSGHTLPLEKGEELEQDTKNRLALYLVSHSIEIFQFVFSLKMINTQFAECMLNLLRLVTGF